MAHTCPDCGLRCHCGGDVDDCEFDGTREQLRCDHCEYKSPNANEELLASAEEFVAIVEANPQVYHYVDTAFHRAQRAITLAKSHS